MIVLGGPCAMFPFFIYNSRYPGRTFRNFEAFTSGDRKFYVVLKCCLTDFEALKLNFERFALDKNY